MVHCRWIMTLSPLEKIFHTRTFRMGNQSFAAQNQQMERKRCQRCRSSCWPNRKHPGKENLDHQTTGCREIHGNMFSFWRCWIRNVRGTIQVKWNKIHVRYGLSYTDCSGFCRKPNLWGRRSHTSVRADGISNSKCFEVPVFGKLRLPSDASRFVVQYVICGFITFRPILNFKSDRKHRDANKFHRPNKLLCALW